MSENAERRAWMTAAEEALADQKCPRASRIQALDISGAFDAAFADDQRRAVIVFEQLVRLSQDQS